MTMTCYEVKTKPEQQQCLAIRKVVFVDEQKVPSDLEVDGKDVAARHFAVRAGNKMIATCRVRVVRQGKDSAAKIERVAVLKEYRGQGVGKVLMTYILQELPKSGDINAFKLGAQTDALPFYEKLGFKAYGDEYMDAGIPHVDMVRGL